MAMNIYVLEAIYVYNYITYFSRSCTSSRGSSVDIATGYGLDGRDQIPGRGKIFFATPHVQAGSGTHPASYLMSIGTSFPGSKATGA
jgi:hypothetical protein